MRLPARVPALLLASFLATSAVACTAEDDATIETGSDWSELAARPSFDLWKGSDGQFRFHLVDAHAAVLVTSEGYATRLGALNGLVSVLDNGAYAANFEVKTGAGGGAYFNLKAANKQIIATSQTYATAALANADVAATTAAVVAYVEAWDKSTGARFALKLDAGGQWYFNLYAKNGALVLRSERYTTEAGALNGIFSVADNGTAKARYLVKAGAGGSYYFVLTATNGQIIGTSESYATKQNAERARDAVIALLPQVALL